MALFLDSFCELRLNILQDRLFDGTSGNHTRNLPEISEVPSENVVPCENPIEVESSLILGILQEFFLGTLLKFFL